MLTIFLSELTKHIVSTSGGLASGGEISCSSLSILPRILIIARLGGSEIPPTTFLVLKDPEFR